MSCRARRCSELATQASDAVSGFFTAIADDQKSVVVYYYDTRSRTEIQDAFVARMQPLLEQQFAGRVSRVDSRGRKGFRITLK